MLHVSWLTVLLSISRDSARLPSAKWLTEKMRLVWPIADQCVFNHIHVVSGIGLKMRLDSVADPEIVSGGRRRDLRVEPPAQSRGRALGEGFSGNAPKSWKFFHSWQSVFLQYCSWTFWIGLCGKVGWHSQTTVGDTSPSSFLIGLSAIKCVGTD